MSVYALELHETLALVLGAGEPATTSSVPAVALADGERILVGSEAVARSRLHPRHTAEDIWSGLDTRPLPASFPEGTSRADLAHRHLLAVRAALGDASPPVLLAVPGSWSADRLGLALGVARASGLPAAGMVDAALAAGAPLASGHRMLHLDLQLRSAVLTELAVRPGPGGPVLARGRVESAAGAGTADRREALLACLAERFVRRTRFDPLEVAAAEQELHDRLEGLLESLVDGDRTELVLEAGGGRSIEVERTLLEEAARPVAEPLLHLVGRNARAGEPLDLLLTPRVASVPGLRARLEASSGLRLRFLEAEAAAAGTLLHAEEIREEETEALPLVTRLCVDEGAEETPAPSRERRDGPPPSHLLHEGRAHALGEAPLWLGRRPPEGERGIALSGSTAGVSRSHCFLERTGGRAWVEDRSRYGTFLNDRRVHGRAELIAGDRLRVGTPGIEVSLIVLEGSTDGGEALRGEA